MDNHDHYRLYSVGALHYTSFRVVWLVPKTDFVGRPITFKNILGVVTSSRGDETISLTLGAADHPQRPMR
jgi:hypothetical protein